MQQVDPTAQIIADLRHLAFPVEDLDELPGNPRRGNVAAVAESYRQFGQRKPIVARRTDGGRGVVIAGNHQLQAARSLGWPHIAVAWVDDDDATAAAFALADNRVADLGTYDDEALLALIRAVDDETLLAATGYTADDVARIGAHVGSTQPIGGDPDQVPEAPPATSVMGDLWLLGDHRVLCGDSTSPTDVERVLDGQPADCVWTDPPYGVDYTGQGGMKIKNDTSSDVGELLPQVVDVLLACARPGAAVYVAAPSGPAGTLFAVELQSRGLFRQRLVWVKDALVLGHSDYHYRHEDIYFGYVPGSGERRGRGGRGWYGDHSQTSVLEYPKPASSSDHPTMKPVGLIAHCLRNSAPVGGLVLDLFGGSGSTLLAAHMLGMRAALVELDPTYVDVICRRWQEATGVQPVNASTGRAHDFTAR